ncbi:MAG: AlpA family transcriptional regulator [Desulfobulbaceae bacterium]|nr:MAG: AlpA family transcriptional regulator [Desulfobulbaceae bacterium]
MHNQSHNTALLRRPEVERRTGLGRSTIYARMKEGDFPQSVSLGRTVAWVEDEIDAWIQERIAARQALAA